MPSPLRLLLGLIVAMIALSAGAGSALAAPPANDNFANAEALIGNRGATYFDLSEATAEAGEPANSGTDERTIWFAYTPTTSGLATFSICDTAAAYAIGGANLTVFTGATLAALSVDSDSSGGCPAGQVNASIVAMGVTAGTTYSIQLGNTSATQNVGGTLVYDFNTALPANDDFGNAQLITGSLPQTIDADTGLATTEPGEPDAEAWGPFNSLWYRWTPSSSGPVSIDACSTGVENNAHPPDSKLQIYTNANDPVDLAGLTDHTQADDGCDSPGLALSHAYLNVSAGTEYWIRIVNYSDRYGAPYELNLRSVTTPEISGPPTIYPQNGHVGIGQTMYAGVPDWFADPAITSVDLQWQLCDAGGVTCNDILGATGSTYEPVLGDLGQRLKLEVTGSNGVQSTVVHSELSAIVETPPANDNFADAINLGSTAPTSVTSDNYFATSETGENSDATVPVDASVWFRWTAPQSRTYFADGCQSSVATYFAVNVYNDGGPVDQLAHVGNYNGACENGGAGSRTFFAATAGNSYWIQVGSLESADFIDFTLSISAVPAPSFVASPALSGAAIEGAALQTTYALADSAISSNETFAWELCDAAGSNCTNDAETTDTLALTQAMVGKRARVTITATNANGSGSASVLSAVIDPDSDGDGVTDGDDTCPTEAGSRPNGCDPSDIVGAGLPTISGSTVLGQQLTVTAGLWNVLHDPLGYTLSYQWYRCPSATAGSCSTMPGGISTAYTLTSSEVGKFIRVLVTASNSDDSATQGTAFTAAVTATADGGGGGTTTPPPPPTNPLTLSVKKSLGNLTPKKGVLTINGAVVTCAATATGPCTGTATFKAGSKKYIEINFMIAPGRSAAVSGKIKSSKLKSIKKAKKVKTTVIFSFAAPGFAPTIASATATLRPQKK